MIGERCKTYTGMPVVGTYRHRSKLDAQTLHRQANDNLVLLPAAVRRARAEAEERREAKALQRRVDRAYREATRADIRWAKAELKRVRCACRSCAKYNATIASWIATMRASLKEMKK